MFPRLLSRGIIARPSLNIRMLSTPPSQNNSNKSNSINSSKSAAPSAASAELTKALLAWRNTRNKAVATKHFQEAQRLAKETPEADIAVLARVHGGMHAMYELEDYDDAAQQMDEAVQILKDSVVSRRTRVTASWQIAQFAHRFSSNWHIAEIHYASAAHYDANNPAILIDHARMFIDRGGGMADYNHAVMRLNSVLARWPDNVAALTWLGFVHDQALRDKERAEAYYERAFKLAPDDVLVLRMYSDFMRESRNNPQRADELRDHADTIVKRKLQPPSEQK